MHAANDTKVVSFNRSPATCSDCHLKHLCVMSALTADELQRVDALAERRRTISTGANLYQIGMPLDRLYVIRAGVVKTYTTAENGEEQITGFHMSGEIVGLDAIASSVHASTAEALETVSVCGFSYERLSSLSVEIPALGRALIQRMAQEIVGDQIHISRLSHKSADSRLATLLLDLAQGYSARGFSDRDLYLKMTRSDIGSFLGLQIETVSRAFGRFRDDGLLDIDRRRIHIRDPRKLANIAMHGVASEAASVGG